MKHQWLVTTAKIRLAGRGPGHGFILAMLLAFMTAMGILLTVAMPRVKTEIQREQEAELVFRGEAIANAIRAYKTKTGGYPLDLNDLAKVRPRIIRKVYTDPMTRQGDWDLITAVQAGPSGDTSGLPIVGVRSKCQKDSFLIYKGKSLISDWPFSAADNLLGLPAGAAALLNSTPKAVGGAAPIDLPASGAPNGAPTGASPAGSSTP